MAVYRHGGDEEETRNSRVLALLAVISTLQWCYGSKKGAHGFKKDLSKFRSGDLDQIYIGSECGFEDNDSSVKIRDDIAEVEYSGYDHANEKWYYGKWEFPAEEVIALIDDAICYGEKYGKPSKYFP